MVFLYYSRFLKNIILGALIILLTFNISLGATDITNPLTIIDLMELSLIIYLIYYGEVRVTRFITNRLYSNLKWLEMANKNISEYELVKKNILLLFDISITLFVVFSQFSILMIVGLYM